MTSTQIQAARESQESRHDRGRSSMKSGLVRNSGMNPSLDQFEQGLGSVITLTEASLKNTRVATGALYVTAANVFK